VQKQAFLFLSLCLMAGCTGHVKPPAEQAGTPVFQKTTYQQLPAWDKDNLRTAMDAFRLSCEKLLQIPAEKPFRPLGTYGDFHEPCRAAVSVNSVNPQAVRSFFETWFDPYEVSVRETGAQEGLFTGYYEASLRGSLKRHGSYQTPLYAVPEDLYTADLGQWYEDLEGKKITAQVRDGQLLRYPDRAAIEREGLPAAEVVVWVDDPVDAFFLQIQGSGVVSLDTGGTMRVGYAGKNGHAYFAIGRALIEREELTKENVSLQTIRAWMELNPAQAQDLMNLNPSYVFFRALETDGPVGAQGVVLTPLRSLAVDKNLYDYGLPVWMAFDSPEQGKGKLAQLVIAQDTGGAIRGVVRGDFFWGYGSGAEERAGKMKSRGKYWFLFPKTISMN